MIVSWKQTIGLIILSVGIILLIFAVREAVNWALYVGGILAVCGIAVALILNQRK
jgi:hypothetical protein